MNTQVHQHEREYVNEDHSEYIYRVQFRVKTVIDLSSLLFNHARNYQWKEFRLISYLRLLDFRLRTDSINAHSLEEGFVDHNGETVKL